MVTIKDIAKELGVSNGTVSKGLNDAPDVSKALKRKILDTAIAMGYSKTKLKSADGTRKLCIFIENMDYQSSSQFGYDIVVGFKQEAIKEGYEVHVVQVSPSFQASEDYDTFMLKNGFAGSFCVGFALEDRWLSSFQTTKTATVLFDNYVPINPNTCYIGTDSTEIMELLVDHLYELGHRKIAFLNGSENSLITEQRMDAFYHSMAKRGLDVDTDLAIYAYFVSRVAEDHIPAILDKGTTAIICGNDVIASGVYTELMGKGLSIPKDISVVGIDVLPISGLLTPPLTTVRQERVLLGRLGFFALNSILLHNMAISRNLLRPELKIRASTGPVKQ